jgi:hypothetical protein
MKSTAAGPKFKQIIEHGPERFGSTDARPGDSSLCFGQGCSQVKIMAGKIGTTPCSLQVVSCTSSR